MEFKKVLTLPRMLNFTRSFCFFGTFLFFLFSPKPVAAQLEPIVPVGKHFFLGLNIAFGKVRDKGHSPQIYSGALIDVLVGHEEMSPKAIKRFTIKGSFGGAEPKTKRKAPKQLSALTWTDITFTYAYYTNTQTAPSSQKDALYFGGAATINADLRSYNLPTNNVFGFNVESALNAGLFYNRKMGTSAWRFQYEAYTPILSYSIRPNYLGMVPIQNADFDFNLGNILKMGKLATWNKNWGFYNRFSFDQKIKEYRRRRLSYVWQWQLNTTASTLSTVKTSAGYESIFKL
jgi:hypothetical protein